MDKPWHICASNAVTGEGLPEGVEWLTGNREGKPEGVEWLTGNREGLPEGVEWLTGNREGLQSSLCSVPDQTC